MLKEFENLRQQPEGFRQLFYDGYFDLYVWYDKKGGTLSGFQLVYDKSENPHSLTWLEKEGYLHNKIDEGERYGAMKMTPILVADGAFDRETVSRAFKRVSVQLDEKVKTLVLEKLEEFGDGLHVGTIRI